MADAWVKGGPISGRAAFGPDGMIYFSVNDHDPFYNKSDSSVRMLAQDRESLLMQLNGIIYRIESAE